MELFPVAATCTCYTEPVVIAEDNFLWADDDIVVVVIPLP